MIKKLLLGAMSCLMMNTNADAQIAANSDFVYNRQLSVRANMLQGQDKLIVNNEDKYNRFKRMRTAGIVLTSAGTALLTTGFILIGQNVTSDGYGGSTTTNDDEVVAGAVCIVTGFMSLGGGIPLWAIGSHKMKKYGAPAVTLQSTRNGAGLVYRF